MRPRFALAAALLLIAVSPRAPAFDREPIQIGDAVLGAISAPYTFAEFPFPAASGTYVRATVTKGAGALHPVFTFFDSVYTASSDGNSAVQVVYFSRSEGYNAVPFNAGTYRILVADPHGGVGEFRLATKLYPQLKFATSGTAATPAPTLAFGAYPGYEATIALKWKGTDPVTLRSVVGPDGAVASAAAPRATSKSFTQAGFHATAVGDYVVQLDVPIGTVKWTATVTLKGRTPRGVTHDMRPPPGLSRATVDFPSSALYPVTTIAGEVGGPNEVLLASTGDAPVATFLHGGAGAGGCARLVPTDGSADYFLYCNDGFSARIVNLVRYADGPWKDLIRSYDADDVRSPQGSGSATLTDLTYDSLKRPTGWSETRRFDASGRTHSLVFSDVTYGVFDTQGRGLIANECAGFRVVHTPPGGAPRTYDYGPLR